MGTNSVASRNSPPGHDLGAKRASISNRGAVGGLRNGSNGHRRPSEGITVGPHSPRLSDRRQSEHLNGGGGYYGAGGRRQSDSPSSRLFGSRRSSEAAGSRRGSEVREVVHSEHCELHRKPSAELDSHELERRRLSEAGLRRPSVSAGEAVLNDDPSSLMVGMQVWVDGRLHGRIAYIGTVHFAKGDMAGVHLEQPYGKNNGSVGGVLYFQCEPKHGVFARLHRLTREPLIDEDDEYNEE